MNRKSVLVLITALVIAVPAVAILGIGDIVFDPQALEQALREFAQLQQQYTQLVQTYQMIRSQYDQMLWMARQIPVSMSLRYGAPWVSWINSGATNTYGTTAGWIAAVNSGANITAGYSSATQPLKVYGPALGHIPADQLD